MYKFRILTSLSIALLMLGCFGEKKEDVQKSYDASRQVTIEKILEDHIKLFSDVDYFAKRPGEYIHYLMNYRANAQTQPVLIASFETNFNALCESDTEFKISLAYSFDYASDDEDPVVRNYPTITIPKNMSTQPKVTAHSMSSMAPLKAQFIKAMGSSADALGLNTRSMSVSIDPDCVADESTACYKFYEYEIESYQKPAPKLVQDAGCPGLVDCKLDIFKQVYKLVIQIYGQPEQVITHEMELSPQIPYFDAFLDDFLWNSPKSGPIYNGSASHCYSSWIIANDEGDQAYIRQCVYAYNFTLGTGDDSCPIDNGDEVSP
ncbi:MAG: hypothetical protein R2827_12015 [Bdellovibrionales bacterium]